MQQFNVAFEQIYATDLVYLSDCWKLCGNAHCCNFSRYKSQFRMMGRTPFQEIPLLPGEYEFLSAKGFLNQFGDYERKCLEFQIDDHVLKAESIIIPTEGCPCEHDIRPTICRLYPLLPVFDIDGRLIGTEQMGIYEEMERIAGLEPACQVTTLPFEELDKFHAMANAIGANPVFLFYIEAYRLVKGHAAERLREKYEDGKNIFTQFELAYLKRSLVDADQLRGELNRLAKRFDDRYGERFRLGMAHK